MGKKWGIQSAWGGGGQGSPEPGSEDPKPKNTEKDSAADQSDSPPKKTVTDTSGKGECPTSEKDGKGEDQSNDSENPENAGCHPEVVAQQNFTKPQSSSG